MAGEGSFFANNGALTVVGAGGTPTVSNINAVWNCKVDTTWSFNELYAWQSIQRLGVAKYEQKVNVSIEWVKWDPTVTTWWPMYILDSSSPSGTVDDTTNVTLFTLTFSWTSSSGVMMKITVNNVYFKNLPIEAKKDDWVHMNLEGVGSSITFANA